MKKKVLIVRLLRFVSPRPKPSLDAIASLFQEAPDARGFLFAYLALPCFDRMNRGLTALFQRRTSLTTSSPHHQHTSDRKETLSLQKFNSTAVRYAQTCHSRALSLADGESQLRILTLLKAASEQINDRYGLARSFTFRGSDDNTPERYGQ